VNTKKLGSSTPSSSAIRVVSNTPATLGISACYIYGIAEFGKQVVLKSRPIDPTGGKPYTIAYKDISALVSRTNYREYDPTDENVLAHNKALQELHDDYRCTVLPLRFSTVAKSELDVQKILSNGHMKFRQKLQSLRGKEEVAVKVYCKIDTMKNEISRVEDMKDPYQINEEMQRRTKGLATNFLEELKKLSKEHILNDLVFEDQIMNAAFLIEESKTKELLAHIKIFESKNTRTLNTEWSGPYVPYSFTDPS
jgi:hypothetical protein